MTEGRERFRVEKARGRDVPALAALAAGSLREAWSEAAYGAFLEQPGALLLVARAEGGAVVGLLGAHRVEDELHVHALVVAPELRRRGVGRTLLEAALGAPAARAVFLEVRPSNVSARAFYGALGFAEVGVRRAYYADGENALLLSRGEGAAPESAGALA